MAREISNSDDIIDSRDVIERLEELESLRGEAVAAALDAGEPESAEYNATFDEAFSDDELAEHESLLRLAQQGEDYAEDWEYGAALIRDSYFEDHARELAEDIGAVPSEYTWPISCIDWEQAARELQYDYTSVDFDGVTYWVR